MLNQFPYTDFHQLNLDWVLNTVKNLYDKITDLNDILLNFFPVYTGEWDINKSYNPLNVVQYNGKYYMAYKHVPAGITPLSTEYWINVDAPGWDDIAKFSKLSLTCPDFYTGSDTDKVKAMLNDVQDGMCYIFIINRMYNITDNLIVPVLNSNYNNMTFIGVSNGSGFTFTNCGFIGNSDSSTLPGNSGGLHFVNIDFIGNNSNYPLFNADSIIRVSGYNCHFTKFNMIVQSSSARGYIQDFCFDNCYFRGGVVTIFKGYTGMYSGYLRGCRIYESTIFDIDGGTGFEGFTVQNCDIEGFKSTPFKFNNIPLRCLYIINNYIETSNVVDNILDLSTATAGCVTFSGNYVHYNIYDDDVTEIPMILYNPQYNMGLICQNNSLAGQMYLLLTTGTARYCTDMILTPNYYNVASLKKLVDNLNSIPMDVSKYPRYKNVVYTLYLPLGSTSAMSIDLDAGANIPQNVTLNISLKSYYKADGTFVNTPHSVTVGIKDRFYRIAIDDYQNDMAGGTGVFEVSYSF